jgi:hypothetical protein
MMQKPRSPVLTTIREQHHGGGGLVRAKRTNVLEAYRLLASLVLLVVLYLVMVLSPVGNFSQRGGNLRTLAAEVCARTRCGRKFYEGHWVYRPNRSESDWKQLKLC